MAISFPLQAGELYLACLAYNQNLEALVGALVHLLVAQLAANQGLRLGLPHFTI